MGRYLHTLSYIYTPFVHSYPPGVSEFPTTLGQKDLLWEHSCTRTHSAPAPVIGSCVSRTARYIFGNMVLSNDLVGKRMLTIFIESVLLPVIHPTPTFPMHPSSASFFLPSSIRILKKQIPKKQIATVYSMYVPAVIMTPYCTPCPAVIRHPTSLYHHSHDHDQEIVWK